MSATSAIEYWHNLGTHHPEWAFRAYGKLIDTLSQDVRERLQLKGSAAESYVVLFGKTQVGKTTLLLDLMGVAPAHAATVSTVLRGGRESGKSATSTAMEYCRSSTDRWGLCRQGKTVWIEQDEEMTRVLGHMRAEMEQGKLPSDTRPCIVHIPKTYFAADDTTAGVRILDLPGDNPANAEEQKHVSQMAKTYLPFADLILLVGKGDDLGFLRPGAITLPGIEDWQSMPYRFRIVTTYSYSSQSIRDSLRQDASIDVRQVRKRLIEQIQRFGPLSEAARNESLYFPLEFGNSWTHTRTSEPELFARMEPIIRDLRTELIGQIINSTTPMGRLRSTLNTHVSIKYILDKKTTEIEQAIKSLTAKHDLSSKELKQWDAAVRASKKEKEELAEILASDPLQTGKKAVEMAAQKLLQVPIRVASHGPRDDLATLRELVSSYDHELRKLELNVTGEGCNRTFWRAVGKNFKAPDPDSIIQIIIEEFDFIIDRINDYWFDTYLSSSNYDKDLDYVESAGEEAKSIIIKKWKQRWSSSVSLTHKQFLSDFEISENNYLINIWEKSKEENNKNNTSKEINARLKEKKKLKQNHDDDMKNYRKFSNFLKEEYKNELENRYRMSIEEKDDVNSLLILFSCHSLMHQYEDFLQISANEKINE